MKKARFWKKDGDVIECFLCRRKCKLKEGQVGVCGVRKVINGELFSLNYGRVAAAHVDPIEKKPFYHFYPGSQVFSISSVGCNFKCKFCCNFELAQEWKDMGIEMSVEEVVSHAKISDGIAFTYNEPTIWGEFVLDVAKEAKKNGLFNVMVTNGYSTTESIKEFGKYIDAVVIDVKNSLNKEAYIKLSSVPNPEEILESILEWKKMGVWIEITNLIVTRWGENEKDVEWFGKWIVENLGDETPYHILRYYPSYKLDLPPTPEEFLLKSVEISKKVGLKFVYLGNVSSTEYENTYCPVCGTKLIERKGFFVTKINLDNGKCPKCGYKIPIKIKD